MPHDIIMPALGMSQDSGKIVAWLKKAGDPVKTGEAIMEVETDKATIEVEAQADGFLTDVRAAAGDDVPVGQKVATISETPQSMDTQVPEAAAARDGSSAEGGALPEGREIIMPALGMAQDTGLIVAWRKDPGDAVAAGDILLEVETDKSVMEVEAGHDGYVAAILADANQAVPVGSVIAIISADRPEEAFARSAKQAGPLAATHTTEAPPAAGSAAAPAKPAARPEGDAVLAAAGGRVLASPKARRLAHEMGLDLARLAQHGVAQPYHVSDLETLKSLGKAPATSAAAAAVPHASVPIHITARIAAGGFAEFMTWLADTAELQLAPRLVWLRFAAAALRKATARGDSSIIVETRLVQDSDGRFVDADRSRFSKPPAESAEEYTDLVVRDFTVSPIVAITTVAERAPVLTIRREHDDYVVSFDFRDHQLDESQAINFVTGFMERLGDPLRQLL